MSSDRFKFMFGWKRFAGKNACTELLRITFLFHGFQMEKHHIRWLFTPASCAIASPCACKSRHTKVYKTKALCKKQLRCLWPPGWMHLGFFSLSSPELPWSIVCSSGVRDHSTTSRKTLLPLWLIQKHIWISYPSVARCPACWGMIHYLATVYFVLPPALYINSIDAGCILGVLALVISFPF